MRTHRRRARLCLAATVGVSTCTLGHQLALAQQDPYDQTVFLGASDAGGASSFSGGLTYQWGASSSIYSTSPYSNSGALPSGSAPASGYAYVVTGSSGGTGGLLRSPAVGSASFNGDSLTIVPYNGQANLYNTSTAITNAQDTTAGLFLMGAATTQTITVNNLVLGNGGAVLNYNRANTVLAGTVTLLPAGTSIDGITTTTSGGIFDLRTGTTAGLTVNATLTGSGLLHIISTGGSSATTGTLNASNTTFSGGVTLDNTIGSGSGSGNLMTLNIDNPAALGTGAFTIGSTNTSSGAIQSSGLGPIIDNNTGADETLSTAPALQWNGSFQFKGTRSLYTGGAATLGGNATATIVGSVLAVNSVAGPYTLTLTGSSNSVVGGALEVPQLSAITASALTLTSGATVALPASSTTPAQFAAAAGNGIYSPAGALMGIDTTGVAGGVYNLNANLPNGSYGITKLGPGTLILSGNNSYGGVTAITNGTVQLGSANALGNTATVNLGLSGTTTQGTLDLNGYSVTLQQPSGGSISTGVLSGTTTGNTSGGSLTNSNVSSLSTLTLTNYTGSEFINNSSYFGSIDGNLQLVINFPVATSSSSPIESISTPQGAPSNYSGGTVLQSGVLSVGTQYSIPTTSHNISFTGGILETSSAGLDFSAGFSQAANQQFNVLVTGTTPFNSSIGSVGGSLTLGNTFFGPAGTLILNAANSYTGPTSVNVGVLEVVHPQALASTSAVNINADYANPFIVGSASVFSTLQINSSSSAIGLTGGVSGGAPITLNLSGLGANSTLFTYRTGITNHNVGYEFFGALQGVDGATETWGGNINLSGGGNPVGISGGFQNGSTGGILKVTGQISGVGPLVLGLNNNSTVVLGAANTYSGETQITSTIGGPTTVQLGANAAIPSGSGLDFAYSDLQAAKSTSFVYGTAKLDMQGFNTSTAYITTSTSTITSYGSIVPTATALESSGLITNTLAGTTSTLTIMAPPPSGSGAFLGTFQDGSGTAKLALDFDGGVQTMTGTNNYSGGTIVDAGTLVASSLAAIGSGNITINSNGGAILQGTSAATIFSKLATGFNGGNWNGSGVNSTAAASDSTHLTAVGMLTPSSQTSFEAQTLNVGDVALKLTYYGDANLDGQVSSVDYTLIDGAYLNNLNSSGPQLTGWQNGDFNYDSVINGSDYTLIDNAFNTQGVQFSTEIASPTAQISGAVTSAVPEPASLALLGLGVSGLLGRRRRH